MSDRQQKGVATSEQINKQAGGQASIADEHTECDININAAVPSGGCTCGLAILWHSVDAESIGTHRCESWPSSMLTVHVLISCSWNKEQADLFDFLRQLAHDGSLSAPHHEGPQQLVQPVDHLHSSSDSNSNSKS